MKESLSIIGITALAIALWFLFMSLWFLRAKANKKLLEADSVTIKSLEDSDHAKG